MAKKKKAQRQNVWLQCMETGDLNYRTSMNLAGGIPESYRKGISKYSSKLQRHSLHKVKRK